MLAIKIMFFCVYRPILMGIYFRDVNSTEQDQLRVDVWDFNPEENMTAKLKKINEVKDARGVRKFIKVTNH